MRNALILVFIFIGLRCSDDFLVLNVVTVPELFQNIKKNNSSRLVLLNVWSTSCMPCIEEFPYIVNLEKQYSHEDLDVKFLSTDWDEKSEAVEEFLLNNGVQGEHFRKNEDYNDQDFINEICTDWSGALPFTGIFDENLILLSHWEGKRDEVYFLKEIDSLLANKREQL